MLRQPVFSRLLDHKDDLREMSWLTCSFDVQRARLLYSCLTKPLTPDVLWERPLNEFASVDPLRMRDSQSTTTLAVTQFMESTNDRKSRPTNKSD